MSTPAVVPDAQPGLSEGARLINTFVAPSKTFTDIRRNQSWWVPWLLISIVSICFMFVVSQKIGYDQITRDEIAKSSRAEQFERLSPEQKEQQMRLSANIMKVAGYASPVSVLLVGLIIAAVLMSMFNFGAGAEISFKQSLAIMFYSWLPALLGSALGIVSLFIGVDKEGFNIRNPVATNPAYFMDPTQHKFVYGMVSALDVFTIWTIILMGIGFSSVSKVKKGAAIGMVAGAYIVYKLVAAGISAI